MDYEVRPFRPGEEGYVAESHRRAYAEEYRWGEAFTSYAERVALDFAERERTPREELWVADAGGRLVGSIMLCESDDPDVGQLRLFLVERDCRRQGIGGALIRALMERARESGYRELVLWTAGPLVDAIRQYERIGFRTVEEKPNADWSLDGEVVTEVKMEMQLS